MKKKEEALKVTGSFEDENGCVYIRKSACTIHLIYSPNPFKKVVKKVEMSDREIADIAAQNSAPYGE